MRCCRNPFFENQIKMRNTDIESVYSFKYLGATINPNNVTEEEIKARITPGNRAYYINNFLQVNCCLEAPNYDYIMW
jgi:hypothetical protein